MGTLQSRARFGVVKGLDVPIPLGMTFIDMFRKFILTAKKKSVFYQSPPGKLLLVHENRSEAEKHKSDTHQKCEDELGLSAIPITAESKCSTVGRQLVLEALYKTSLLVSTQAVG